MHIIKLISRFFNLLKNTFLSGLFTILPIAATIFFITFTYNFVVKSLQPLKDFAPLFLKTMPGVEFILATCLIFIIGIILRVVIADTIIEYFESWLAKIPLVRIVYSSAKTLVDFFKMPTHGYTKRTVVLITYPRPGQYHLAFLLESADNNYATLIPEGLKRREGKYCKVFMPNSPNPSSGYFFIMPEDDIIYTDISFEEAIKAIVSCGLITPDSLKKSNNP